METTKSMITILTEHVTTQRIDGELEFRALKQKLEIPFFRGCHAIADRATIASEDPEDLVADDSDQTNYGEHKLVNDRVH